LLLGAILASIASLQKYQLLCVVWMKNIAAKRVSVISSAYIYRVFYQNHRPDSVPGVRTATIKKSFTSPDLTDKVFCIQNTKFDKRSISRDEFQRRSKC
jgi:hypothetical protein